MKIKKMIAVVFTAALVTAGTGITGLAADKVVSAEPNEIVLSETLGLDAGTKEAFEELLNSHAYKNRLKNEAVTVVEQYGDKIAELFKDEDVDEIKVSIDVELKKVVTEDGKIQYVQYFVAPKACGFKDGSQSGDPKKLDGDEYQLGDGTAVSLPVPEGCIADDAKEGAYMISGDGDPYYWPIEDSWFNGLMDHFGEVTIVPSRWHIFPDEYYHMLDEDSFWAGTDSLTVGTTITVSFGGYPFDKIDNESEEYVDCKMSADGGSMIITGKKDTEGYEWFFLIRELESGLELKMPFNVRVIDASQSSSSSSGGSSHSVSAEPERSGEWKVGEKGWWYRFEDGTYPAGGWMALEWRGKTNWYYFNAEGYMVSGWITDTDGNRYFLHDKMDGTQGYMYTGWHEIDGKWYYFSEETGGPLGSLLVNTTTPDGSEVGADGARIS